MQDDDGAVRPSLLSAFVSTHRVERAWVQQTTGASCAVLDPIDGEGPRIFVKVDSSSPTSWPAHVHEIYRLLDAAPGSRRIAPKPVAFDASGISYEWIDGEPVDAVARRLGRSSDPGPELTAVAAATGRALAELHDRWTSAAPIEPGPERVEVPWRTSWCAWACGARRDLRVSRAVRSPADLGPWNIVITEDGAVFIDLDDGGPGVREVDVGRLAHRTRSLVDKLGRRDSARSRRDRMNLIDRAVGALIDGYRVAGAVDDVTALSHRLIAAGSAAESLTEFTVRIRRVRKFNAVVYAVQPLRWLLGDLVGAWRTPRVNGQRSSAPSGAPRHTTVEVRP